MEWSEGRCDVSVGSTVGVVGAVVCAGAAVVVVVVVVVGAGI